MGLRLAEALRLALPGQPVASAVAFVGAGGKTTAMFQLARQLPSPVIVTTTTHLGAWQAGLADQHVVAERTSDLPMPWPPGVTLVTGPQVPGDGSDAYERFSSPPAEALLWLHDISVAHNWPLLIEADGAHGKPLKAPAAREPAIPPFVQLVTVLVGLTGLGKPLSPAYVQRSEQFAALGDLPPGDAVTPESLVRVLVNPLGGCKNIPGGARRIALLNQAEDPAVQAQARGMAPGLLSAFDAVVIASLRSATVHAVHEPVAGILLAAGGSTRMGRPKPLLDWGGQPFVRAVAAAALQAGLKPVVVITGAAADVSRAVDDLPVTVIHNAAWEMGQASSIRAGLQALPASAGGAVFLLADQPQVTADVIRALLDRHAASLVPIVAPLVRMERRANPVLFDRLVFPDLLALEGDIGGRAVFWKHRVEYVPWHDERLLLDVDTEEDYRRLLGLDLP